MIRTTRVVLNTGLLALSAVGLSLGASAHASGTDNDPLDGTGVANNPNAEYGVLFGSICTWFKPGSNPFPPDSSQADEGMNIAFGVVFACDPNDPDAGFPQEDVDRDPLPNEG